MNQLKTWLAAENNRCHCRALTGGHRPGWFERLLLKFVPHCDIVKVIGECRTCGNSGFTGTRDYDGVCGDCGGQSAYAPPETLLYLRRFYLWRSKWIGKNWGDLYLHHIVRSDDDPDPHDHPWDFSGLVLRQGYMDELWFWHEGQRLGPAFEIMRPGRFFRRRAEHLHRVVLAPNTTAWTLIKAGPYRRFWNFITEDGPVFWKTYLGIGEGK